MAEMTMTYKYKIGSIPTSISKPEIIKFIKTYGDKFGICKMFGDDDTRYLTINPVTSITILDEGQIQISDVHGKKRNIKKIKSKLLKMIKDMKLK